MSDGISGISRGGDSLDRDGNTDGKRILEELDDVGDLESLIEYIEGQIGTEGIERVIDEADGAPTDVVVDGPAAEAPGDDDILEEQLEELEGIGQDTELLRRLNARLGSVENAVKRVASLNSRLYSRSIGEFRGELKDIGFVTLDEADSSQDLIDDDDIGSSTITNVITVKAEPRNDGSIYIGEDTVGIERGFQIQPGEKEDLKLNNADNNIRVVSESAGDSYSYIARGPSDI